MLPAARRDSSSETTRNPTASGSLSSRLSPSEETCTKSKIPIKHFHRVKRSGSRAWHTALLLTSNEILRKFLNPWVPQFPHLSNGWRYQDFLTGLLWAKKCAEWNPHPHPQAHSQLSQSGSSYFCWRCCCNKLGDPENILAFVFCPQRRSGDLK